MYAHMIKTNQISGIGPKNNSLSSKKRPNATCAIRSRQQQHKKKKNYLKYSAQDKLMTFSLSVSHNRLRRSSQKPTPVAAAATGGLA
jgi:hypothetical protein